MPDRPASTADFPTPEPLRFSPNSFLTIVGEGWGDPTASPVVLLHGGGQTRHSWGDTARRIAQRGWYAVALDARGHGESSWSPDGQYQVEDLVDDLKGVVAQLAAKPALVGASLGGITALLAEGESTVPFGAALVLVDTAPRVEQKGIERIFAFMNQHAAGFADLEEAAAAVAAYLPHRPRPADGRRLEKNLRRATDGRYYWHWDPRMLKSWQDTDPNHQLRNTERMFAAARRLAVPTLIVRGGVSDVVSERVVSEFLEAVPHARSADVSGAGHTVAGDSNHAFTNAVIDFLSDAYPAR